jgi:hypothetical protein
MTIERKPMDPIKLDCQSCNGYGIHLARRENPGKSKRVKWQFCLCPIGQAKAQELTRESTPIGAVNKFSAEPTTRGALKFGSKREARRYDELCNLELAGEIKFLQVHPRYPLQSEDGSVTIRYPNGRIAVYTADFQYEEQNDDDTETVVTEDVKSKPTMTEASTLRMAVFSSLYGREVRITK